MSDSVFLADMDDSLANYHETLLRDLEALQSPTDPPIDLYHSYDVPHIRARIRLIRSVPGWWMGLTPIPLGIELFRLAEAMGFNCKVLSKGPANNSLAWKEKVDWCQMHLNPTLIPNIVSEKGGTYGKVLYDDHVPYMEEWLKHHSRGLGIMLTNSQNEDFRHKNVLHWNGDFATVTKALERVLKRMPREPLDIADLQGV